MPTADDEIPATHATTAREARSLIRRATRCITHTTISGDEGVDVDVSKAALLRALAHLADDDPCGGVFWEDGVFKLDTCA